MQGMTASSENSSVEVQSKCFTLGNTYMTSSRHNRVSIPPKGLESICRVTGTEEKKQKALDSMNLQIE